MSCEHLLPVKFDAFSPSVSGDTYPEGVSIVFNGWDFELDRVTVSFRVNPSQSTADLVLDSDLGEIEIQSSSPDSWRFIVKSFECDLAPSDYFYQIKTFYGGAYKITILTGIFTVNQSI